ncbi:MAG: DUF2214 family protein [Gemmatimonadales bacterium]
MLTASILSTMHLFALAIGLPGIFLRARWLGAVQKDPAALAGVFRADNAWGIAAALWLVTGLARAFGPFEKGEAFYLHSGAFWLKMTLFALVVALEVWPMITLIKWRRAQAKKLPIDLSIAPKLQLVSRIELALTCAMPFVASAMARGVGFGWSPL